MNLAHLYYFRKLVEAGSYSAASDELFIAQPTLSLAISSLEKELNAPLLRKKRNGIELTEDGEEFYNAVLTATNALDSSASGIKQRAAEEYSTIRLGVVYSVQSRAWSNMIQEFRHVAGSRVHINLKQSNTKALLRDVKSGQLDVAFAGIIANGDPELESIPCFTQGCALVVHKDHSLASRAEITLDELAGLQVISYRVPGGPFDAELDNLLAGHKKVRVRHEYTDEISLCSMVVANPSSVAIVSHSWLLKSFPDIVTIKITDAPENFHQFYLSYKKRGRKSLAVESFINFAKNYTYGNTSPSFTSINANDPEEAIAQDEACEGPETATEEPSA